MTEALFRLNRQVMQASRVIAWLAVCGLLLISLAIMLDVLLRWLFLSPIHGLEDIVILTITVAIAACFVSSFGLRTNITVRFVGKALGPRASAWLEVFGHSLTFVFIAAVAWQLVVHASEVGAQVTFILALPLQPTWWAAAVLSIAAAVVQGLVLLAQLASAVSGRPLTDGGEKQSIL